MAEGGLYLEGVNLIFINTGLVKARANILRKQLVKFGGKESLQFDNDDTTHILTVSSNTHTTIEKQLVLKIEDIKCPIVDIEWLSMCLRDSKLLPTTSYVRRFKTEPLKGKSPPPSKPMLEKTVTKGVEAPPELYPKKESILPISGRKRESSMEKDELPEDNQLFSHCVKEKPSAGRWKLAKKVSDTKTSRLNNILNQLDSDSDYDSPDEEVCDSFKFGTEDETIQKGVEYSPPKKKLKGFSCMTAASQLPTNHNKHITDKLGDLAALYKTRGERWRERSYSKAIAVLKKHTKEITTWEEAKNLPCIGENLADKIWEIISSGKLRKLDHLSEDKDTNSIAILSKIWGAGLVTANNWIAQGYRTLDDIREKAELTRQQQIGLKYYDEFIERIPRKEVAEIESVVEGLVKEINHGLIVLTCGSYRRGKSTCGDVDCLVSHPDGKSHKGVFQQVLQRGHEASFLTDDLSIHDGGDHGQSKYLGVCLLKGDDRKHRRLDIIVVPYSQWACALLYFTGSAHFNRSMRLYAQKQGMHLSEQHLYTDVMRKGSTILHEGTQLPTFTEEDVFKHLGLDYLEPHDRDK